MEAITENSWTVDISEINKTTYDLTPKNPNGVEEVIHRGPKDILDDIAALDAESGEVLQTIRELL